MGKGRFETSCNNFLAPVDNASSDVYFGRIAAQLFTLLYLRFLPFSVHAARSNISGTRLISKAVGEIVRHTRQQLSLSRIYGSFSLGRRRPNCGHWQYS
jgi:hypothetical protein